ncbi:glycosyltransferase family 4 protein [Fusobacterium polymorphum]|jgi:glycosyltransferase|uniref:glycosyltransferase family 4 protein n=1 Tax=Fusobacterium nucleatum subsp. polymorphum TaxID=76857 RepID=UPI00300A87E0
MKNIWFINEYDLPPKFSKYRRRYDMCKYLLKKNKYKLNIICSSFMHGTGGQYAYNKKEKIEYQGINVYILKGISYIGNIKRFFSMLVFMLKIIFFKFPKEEKPDLIYASSPHLFAALGALIQAKRNKCKFILEVRDLWPETFVQIGAIKRNGIIHKFFLILEKYLYKNADKIVNLDPFFDYMINLGISREKMIFLSNGVDLEEFDRKQNLEIDLDKNKFNITYTGAIGIANNLDPIIDLAKLVSDENIMFNIVGYGPLKKFLVERVENEKLKNIKFFDPIEKSKVPEVLRESDVLILSVLPIDLYQYGASFNKLFEYWASSRPILFFGNVKPDYIKESNSGISVTTNSIDDLKSACLNLYNISEVDRLELGKNGRKYVEDNFDWKNLTNKVDKVFDELLQGEVKNV